MFHMNHAARRALLVGADAALALAVPSKTPELPGKSASERAPYAAAWACKAAQNHICPKC